MGLEWAILILVLVVVLFQVGTIVHCLSQKLTARPTGVWIITIVLFNVFGIWAYVWAQRLENEGRDAPSRAMRGVWRAEPMAMLMLILASVAVSGASLHSSGIYYAIAYEPSDSGCGIWLGSTTTFRSTDLPPKNGSK